MNETQILSKYFKPLARNFEDSIGLNDDAAILKYIDKKNYVISVDNFISGVHCPLNLSEDKFIIRSILTAASDLAAMGAIPHCLFLSLSAPKKSKKKIFPKITLGIRKALKLTDMRIAGGDLCSYRGPLMSSVTVVGYENRKKIIYRNGAKPGDLLIITGDIGEAKIGLDCLRNKNKKIPSIHKKKFLNKFYFPPIRHKFSNKIATYVNACIDLSDGMLADASKIARLSKCGLEIISDKIPLSEITKIVIDKKYYSLNELINAGDDYELAFAVSKKNLNRVLKIASEFKIKISIVGFFTDGNKVKIDRSLYPLEYSHF
tara:strand:+ start:369 stop:1322 length:954 start_codon:yes stop_codon:yes gene_type:complete